MKKTNFAVAFKCRVLRQNVRMVVSDDVVADFDNEKVKGVFVVVVVGKDVDMLPINDDSYRRE